MIATAYSGCNKVPDAVEELKRGLSAPNTKLVLYFASTHHDPVELSGRMQQAFPDSLTIGCTTAGEIGAGRMLRGSVVAMAFDDDAVADVSVAVVRNISHDNAVPAAFEAIQRRLGAPMSELSVDRYVGLLLIDGLRNAEEKIIGSIGDLTNVLFVGGSAGDDLKFERTYVFANGEAYTDAAVLAVLQPRVSFDLIKTQSFRALPGRLTATKVDEEQRLVLEFDHLPAVEAYARALGCTTHDALDGFAGHPVGLMVGNEPYVRGMQRAVGSSIKFYCQVLQGMTLSLLEATDIVSETRSVIQASRRKLGGISGLVTFNCIERTLTLEREGRLEEYGELFNGFPAIGFSTYGEQFLGHVSQTSTMVVFGR
jgi:hypothetical protein